MRPNFFFCTATFVGALAALTITSAPWTSLATAQSASRAERKTPVEPATGPSGYVHVELAPLDLEQFCRSADEIVLGTVLSVEEAGPADGLPCQRVLIANDGALKGDPGPTFELLLPGGERPGQFLRIPAMPVFAAGEEVLLFLTRDAESGARGVLGLRNGRYAIQRRANGDDRVAGLHAANMDLTSFLVDVTRNVHAQPR